METQPSYSLCEAADALEIESWRVSRLGRFLGLTPSEKLIPEHEVRHIALEYPVDGRYFALLQWLLATYTSPQHAATKN